MLKMAGPQVDALANAIEECGGKLMIYLCILKSI